MTRITDPWHHFLGLELSRGGDDHPPLLELVSAAAPQARVVLFNDEDPRSQEILEGLRAVNQRYGTLYYAERIRICQDDQYRPGIYRQMAESLIEHVRTQDVEIANADYPALDDEMLTRIADRSFRVYDAHEAA